MQGQHSEQCLGWESSGAELLKLSQGPEHKHLLHRFLCLTYAVPFLSQLCVWSLKLIHLQKLLVQLL